MPTTDTSADRRQFLRRLAALVAGLSLAGVSACGEKEEAKKTDPPKRLPPPPGKKPKEVPGSKKGHSTIPGRTRALQPTGVAIQVSSGILSQERPRQVSSA